MLATIVLTNTEFAILCLLAGVGVAKMVMSSQKKQGV